MVPTVAPSSKPVNPLTAAARGEPLQLVPCFYSSVLRPPNPAFPLLIHSSLYAVIGGVGGMAFGLGLSGPAGAAKGLLAGAMGAVLGAIIYNVCHTIAFPLEWDLSAMPGKGAARLSAHLCTALTMAACVVLATEKRLQTRRRASPLTEEDG